MEDTARYILAIAEKGSISLAAESVHMSQSALSQRLANEEKLLGVRLFNRGHVPIQITEAGYAYLDWARKALQAEAEMREEFAALKVGRRRALRIGTSAARYSSILCDAAARFCTENPTCRLEFHETGKRELVNAAFANDLIDFAVMTPQQPEPSLYLSTPICEERYVYVAPRAWNLPASVPGETGTPGTHGARNPLPVVDLNTVCTRPFVMPTFANRLTAIIDSLFALGTSKPPIIASCVSPAMQLALVDRGLGASIITNASDIAAAHPDLVCYDVQGITGSSYLYYSRKMDGRPSPDEQAFMAIIRELLDEKGLLIR